MIHNNKRNKSGETPKVPDNKKNKTLSMLYINIRTPLKVGIPVINKNKIKCN